MRGRDESGGAARYRMKSIGRAVVLSLLVAACAGDTSLRRATDDVAPLSVGDPGEVNAHALASAMTRTGFSRDEVLELGPQIRRALAERGGAQARRRGQVHALFSHSDGQLYVTSGNTGTFVTSM